MGTRMSHIHGMPETDGDFESGRSADQPRPVGCQRACTPCARRWHPAAAADLLPNPAACFRTIAHLGVSRRQRGVRLSVEREARGTRTHDPRNHPGQLSSQLTFTGTPGYHVPIA
jgi:hypothetical protein